MVSRNQAAPPQRRSRLHLQASNPAITEARSVTASDLDTVNQVVAESVRSWELPERVHRLATPALNYDSTDLAHMSIALLCESNGDGIGVAAWEDASRHQVPDAARALLLHGLYIVPRYQRMGVGTRLADHVLQWARDRQFDGVVVRAWRDAMAFFAAIGFQPISHGETANQNPRNLWRAVDTRWHDEPVLHAWAAA